MFAIFAKQKGRWKFYSFLSNSEHLQSELNHLKDQDTPAVSQPMHSLDVEKIHDIESKLNS